MKFKIPNFNNLESFKFDLSGVKFRIGIPMGYMYPVLCYESSSAVDVQSEQFLGQNNALIYRMWECRGLFFWQNPGVDLHLVIRVHGPPPSRDIGDSRFGSNLEKAIRGNYYYDFEGPNGRNRIKREHCTGDNPIDPIFQLPEKYDAVIINSETFLSYCYEGGNHHLKAYSIALSENRYLEIKFNQYYSPAKAGYQDALQEAMQQILNGVHVDLPYSRLLIPVDIEEIKLTAN